MAIDIIARGMIEESYGDISHLSEQIDSHTGNGNIHVTTVDKSKWNGYDAEINQNKSDISALYEITSSGETVDGASSYTLTNAVDYPIMGLKLYGKSTQDGTPTPENPVDIVSAGDSGSVSVQACGKNLFNYTFETATRNGVTCKNNGDGTYSVNGTTTSKTDFAFLPFNILNTFKGMKLVGCPNNTVNARLVCNYLNDSGEWQDYDRDMGNGVILNKDYPRVAFAIVVDSGVTCNNLVFKPMITTNLNATYDDFEPYKGTTANITSAMPLCGIPVAEGGNYTDSSGQQWICDELVYNADGTGKVVKRTAKYTFIGNETISGYQPKSGAFLAQCSEKLINAKNVTNNQQVANIICSHLDKLSADSQYANVEMKNSISINKNGIIYFNIVGLASAAEYKSKFEELYNSNNPLVVIYELAEPQEIPLAAAETAQLRALQTFNGITNISNDGGADMDVSYCTNKMLSKYVMPITTGLQAQIDELKAAVLSLGGNV